MLRIPTLKLRPAPGTAGKPLRTWPGLADQGSPWLTVLK